MRILSVFVVLVAIVSSTVLAEHDASSPVKSALRAAEAVVPYRSTSALMEWSDAGASVVNTFRARANGAGVKLGANVSCRNGGDKLCGVLVERDGSISAPGGLGKDLNQSTYAAYEQGIAALKVDAGNKKRVNLCGVEKIYRFLEATAQVQRDGSSLKTGKNMTCVSKEKLSCCAFYIDPKGAATPAPPKLDVNG